ncbi:MAG: hypothetical protein LBP54_07335, partial [Campylobacteraceae bacterium]|nr:hypothetical protein [Campylobacteraceae bacterium]
MDGLTTKTNTLNLFKFKVLSSFASMLIKFLTIAIALFFLVGCGGGGGSSGGGDNPPSNQTVYRVSFYDANLDFNGSASVSSDNPVANITRLKADLGITATALYRASSS